MFSLLKPLNLQYDFEAADAYAQIGSLIDVYTIDHQPDLSAADLVIIGVEEQRNAINNDGVKYAPDVIRTAFYNLYPGEWHLKIADIGNLVKSDNIKETYEHLHQILDGLPQDTNIILLGGSQDLTVALTNFYDQNNKPYNLSVIDAFIDSSLLDQDIDNENYLTYILGKPDVLLHNLSLFGIQTYYNHPSKFKMFDQLYVDYYKLGEIQNNIQELEPEIREADIVSIDIRSIRYADMPAHVSSQPNGLTGLEICKISRMAGIASNNRILGMFEYNPMYDKNNTGANLAAQVLWYYVEGKNIYQNDYPKISKETLLKFYVENEVLKLVFYKNPETNRWWVEIPKITPQSLLFACSETDYQAALKMKMSSRLYRIINKMSV